MHLTRRWKLRISLMLIWIAGMGYFVLTGRLERYRIERHGRVIGQATAPERRLLETQLIGDLERLASAEFEGRRTGSEGGRKARAFVRERFGALGLRPFGAGFDQAFTFTHHSIKGLVTPKKPYRTEFTDAANVVGYVVGRADPERFIVVSAHYDHLGVRNGQVYAGADDNASGVAAMLGIAGYFAAHPPAHSMLFAAFDAEELGLEGSAHFVASPPVPKEKLAIDVNLDMVSRSERGEIYVAGTWYTPDLRAPVERAARRRRITVSFGHDRPWYLAGSTMDWTSSSDHRAFHEAGLPFLYFGVEDHPDVHSPTDTASRIDRPFFLEAAELALETVLELDREPSLWGASVR